MRYLSQMLGSDLLKYTVGSGHEQQNPTSGLRAFADIRTIEDVDDDIAAAVMELAQKKLELETATNAARRIVLQRRIRWLENERLPELKAERDRILRDTGHA